ncbi:uncharacterized protein [Ptychodera flava]|uniref:uncharacterized protein n=1 Tax=Ptychodera flava TaxID=63121 RepID=UPI00396A650C
MACFLCECCSGPRAVIVRLPKPAEEDYSFSSIYYGVRCLAAMDAILMFTFFVAFSFQQANGYLTPEFKRVFYMDPMLPIVFDGLCCFVFGFVLYAFLSTVILKARNKQPGCRASFFCDFGRLMRKSPAYLIVFTISVVYFLATTVVAAVQLFTVPPAPVLWTNILVSSNNLSANINASTAMENLVKPTTGPVHSLTAVHAFCVFISLTCVMYYFAESFCVLSIEESIADRKTRECQKDAIRAATGNATDRTRSAERGKLQYGTFQEGEKTNGVGDDKNDGATGGPVTVAEKDETDARENFESTGALDVLPLEPIIACLPYYLLIFLDFCCLANCVGGILNFALTSPFNLCSSDKFVLSLALIPLVAVGKLKCKNISVFYSCRSVRWREVDYIEV